MDPTFRTVETIIRQWVLKEERVMRINVTSLQTPERRGAPLWAPVVESKGQAQRPAPTNRNRASRDDDFMIKKDL